MKGRKHRWWALALVAGFTGGGWLWQSHLAAQAPVADTPANAEAKEHAQNLSRAFRKAADAILPSVVTIETATRAKMAGGGGRRSPGGANPFKGTPFEDFFNDDQLRQFGDQLERRSPRSEGTGTGVIIDASGVILTNNHVVEGADVITVRLADGREFKATGAKTDPQTDLAIIRIENAGKLPAAQLGNSDEMMIGDWVIAVGNPFGLNQTVSAGIISAKGRNIGSGQRSSYLQTDAAINPGNSGGPLVNLNGEVVGINTAIASNSGSFAGIGFAVPVNLAKWVAPQLMAGGQVKRAYLGVGIEQVSAELASQFGVKHGEGVLVTEVFPNTPAEAAGLREGDVVLEFAGVRVRSPRELQEVVERSEMGSTQKALVLRDGKEVTVNVVAKALPEKFGMRGSVDDESREDGRGRSSSNFHHQGLGLSVSDVTPSQTRQLGFEGYTGVLVTEVDPDGAAFEAGLREGMLVRKVGRDNVTTVDEFRKAVENNPAKDGILLLVRTSTGNRYVVVEPQTEASTSK